MTALLTNTATGRGPSLGIEYASRDEITALQIERTRNTLRHVYFNVPHYRQAFDKLGVHPDDFHEMADLANYPMTEKEDLRRNYPFGMFAVPQDQVARIHASSGITGLPTVVGYTHRDIEVWSELVARSLRAGGMRPGTRSRSPSATGCSPAVSASTTGSRNSARPPSPPPAA